MSIGLNITSIPDKGKLLQFASACNLAAANVLNNPDFCRELKDAQPNCDVTYRLKGGSWKDDDGEGILSVTPAEYIGEMLSHLKGDKRIRISCGNEMPLNARTVKHLCDLITEANRQFVSLVVLNIATGNPEPEKRDPKTNAIIQESQWEIAKPLLQLLETNPQHRLGIHEYAGGVITSGLIGGNPTMIAPGEWPALVPFTRYHCGRFQFLLEYCQRAHLKPPRILITEHGFDDTSDIKPWLLTLRRTAPYMDIRGWRSLTNQWVSWWPMWSAEKAYAEQLIWADKTLYRGTPVEAQCIFCWGDSGGWMGFDIAGATELQALLIAYSKEVIPMPLPFPDKTDMRWRETTNMSGANYYVRPEMRVIDMPTLPKINAGERFSFIQTDDPNWLYGKNGAGNIGYVHKGILTVEAPPPPPEPPPPHVPPDDPPIAVATLLKINRDQWQWEIDRATKELDALEIELHALKNRMQKLQTQIGLYKERQADIDKIAQVVGSAAIAA